MLACRAAEAASADELVLRRLEFPGLEPVLPGHAAPQGAVHAVLVHVPAVATTGAPHRAGQIVLQLGVVLVLRAPARHQPHHPLPGAAGRGIGGVAVSLACVDWGSAMIFLYFSMACSAQW